MKRIMSKGDNKVKSAIPVSFRKGSGVVCVMERSDWNQGEEASFFEGFINEPGCNTPLLTAAVS